MPLESCVYAHVCVNWKKSSFRCRYFSNQCKIYDVFKEKDRLIEEELARQDRTNYTETKTEGGTK